MSANRIADRDLLCEIDDESEISDIWSHFSHSVLIVSVPTQVRAH
jgi:hypothetical protein